MSRTATHTVRFDQPLRSVHLASAAAQIAGAVSASGDGISAVETDANQLAETLEHISEQLSRMHSGRHESIAILHQVAIDLAVAVAGKILFGKIEAGEYPLTEMVSGLLGHTDARDTVTVLLHPDDLECLQLFLAGEQSGNAAFDHVTWLASPDLPRGAARLDASGFALFYDPTIQLGEIRQSLLEILHDSEIERRQTGLAGQGLRRFPERRASG